MPSRDFHFKERIEFVSDVTSVKTTVTNEKTKREVFSYETFNLVLVYVVGAFLLSDFTQEVQKEPLLPFFVFGMI